MNEEYFKIKACVETDLLVATKVLDVPEWDGEEDYEGSFPMVCQDENGLGVALYERHGDVTRYFAPSVNMKDAWIVVMFMVNNGWCPALIFDDNGHWALPTEGGQSIAFGHEPDDVSTSFLIEAKMWCDTAELAICQSALYYFDEDSNIEE